MGKELIFSKIVGFNGKGHIYLPSLADVPYKTVDLCSVSSSIMTRSISKKKKFHSKEVNILIKFQLYKSLHIKYSYNSQKFSWKGNQEQYNH